MDNDPSHCHAKRKLNEPPPNHSRSVISAQNSNTIIVVLYPTNVMEYQHNSSRICNLLIDDINYKRRRLITDLKTRTG